MTELSVHLTVARIQHSSEGLFDDGFQGGQRLWLDIQSEGAAFAGCRTHRDAADITGLAIWASVSDEVDAKIREQIKAGVWTLRLGAEDWTSGKTNWLIDVIAPDRKTTASVIANFKQVVKEGDLRLHPLVTRLVDAEVLEKMGAQKVGGGG